MKVFFVYVALAALTLAVFALWPGLDLAVSHLFYDNGGFAGQTAGEKFARAVLGDAWAVVLALYAGLGFTRVGLRKAYLYGKDALVLRLPLADDFA